MLPGPRSAALTSLTLLVVLVAELPAETPADVYGDPLPEGVLARMGTERLRHPFAIALHFAADSKTLLSIGQDQTVRFWDLETGKLQRLQRLPQKQVVLALSADGKTAALKGDEHLLLWDVLAAREIRRLETGKLAGSKRLNDVALSPDGKRVAAGDREGMVLLWDTVGDKPPVRHQHRDKWVRKLAFAPDGKTLAAVGDAHLVLWNVADGKELRVKPLGRMFSARPAFSADGKWLALPSNHGVGLVAVVAGKDEPASPGDGNTNKGRAYVVAVAPDNRTLAVGTEEGLVLCDRLHRPEAKKLPGFHAHGIAPYWLSFSPDGKRLALLRWGKITLWDTATGTQLLERPSHADEVQSVAVSPNGRWLASASGGDDSVRLWDAHTGKPIHVWPMPHPRIAPLLFTPDSNHLIAGGLGGACSAWDLRTGKGDRVFALPKEDKNGVEQISTLTLSADGKRLTALSVRRTNDKGIFKGQRHHTTWDVDSGKIVDRKLLRLDSRPFFFYEELSPDGRFLAFSAGRGLAGPGLAIGDVQADRLLRPPPVSDFGPRAFSPDGNWLAVGGQQANPAARVAILDVKASAVVLNLAAGRVWHRCFSPDGCYLLTAGETDLRLWELVSGKEVLRRSLATRIAPNTSSFATALAFSADGRSAALATHDANVLLCDLAPATRRSRPLRAEDLERLWTDLAGSDAARSYQAAGTLIADPQRAVPFLRQRLQPVKEDAPRIARLIADLDSDTFAVRDAASKELAKMDDAAHARLRQAIKTAPTLELRHRIEMLLSAPWLVQSPEKLRQLRAVMVLEQIGDAEARRILQRLGEGAAEARQTREARIALQRLSKTP